MSEIEALQDALGYRYADPGLIEEALTHRSVEGPNNERLEFLGDSILNFVIAAELFRLRPEEPEGALSRLRANLVNRSSLAELGRQLGLGSYLRLGGGERKSGGRRRDSILADALEAVFGAAFLDGGFEAARDLIIRLYSRRLAQLPAAAELKDPKTRLQEYLQGFQLPLPTYEVLDVQGKAHEQIFRVRCSVDGLGASSEGQAGSRRKAEQVAADALLGELQARPRPLEQI